MQYLNPDIDILVSVFHPVYVHFLSASYCVIDAAGQILMVFGFEQ